MSCSAIRAICNPPTSTQRMPSTSSTSAPITALASASSPITSVSESTARSSPRSAPAPTVWNAATRRVPCGRSVRTNSAADPCHGWIACDARPPTALINGLVQSQTTVPVRIDGAIDS